MYTVYGRCGQYGRYMVHTLAYAAGAWFIWTLNSTTGTGSVLELLYDVIAYTTRVAGLEPASSRSPVARD